MQKLHPLQIYLVLCVTEAAELVESSSPNDGMCCNASAGAACSCGGKTGLGCCSMMGGPGGGTGGTLGWFTRALDLNGAPCMGC